MTYNRKVVRTTWYGAAGNLFLAAIKLAGGINSNSAALIADAVNSMSDIGSSLVVLLGMRVARRRPDAEHPYGHGKAESIAAGLVALIILAAGLELARGALVKLVRFPNLSLQPIGTLAIWVEVCVIAIKEGLFQYSHRLAKKLGSPALMAQAYDHRSDVYCSSAALLGILGGAIGGPRLRFLDQVASLVVAGFIVVAAVRVFRVSAGQLMDEMPPASEMKRVRNCAAVVDGVRGVEKIFARRVGQELIIDIHIEVEPSETVERAHLVAQKVRDKLVQECKIATAVMVHVEPYYQDDHH